MLNSWLSSMAEAMSPFGNLAVRCVVAALTAFVVSLATGAWLIRTFRRKRVIEDTTQPDHAGLNAIQSKRKDVPTMGGLMMAAGIVVATLLWCDLGGPFAWAGLAVAVLMAGLGLVDDIIKLRGKGRRGLTKKQKLLVQFAVGGALGFVLMRLAEGRTFDTRIAIPFVGGMLQPGLWYIPWTAFIVVATSNATNLTDGIDGLAGGCAVLAAAVLALLGITGVAGLFPGKLAHPGLPVAAMLAASLLGAALGFLWYNCHPAQIFMGDTGSLMIGGLLAYVALLLKFEVLFFLIGLVFFVDELTVALQIACYKLTKRRIFPITPIHHYFQVHRKWPDQKITVRAWIIGTVAGIVSLVVLRFF